MSQSLFRGSGVALVTPMTPDGIDFPTLEQLIEWHIASGTDALILCATTPVTPICTAAMWCCRC